MKIVLLCAALAASPAFAAERTLSITDFDRLRVDGNFTVEVKTGPGTSARVIGTQAAIEATSVVVQGRQMTIRRNTTAWGGYPGQVAGVSTVRITVPTLTSVWVNGPGKVSVDRLKGARVSAALEGAGDLSVANVTADDTTISIAGPGKISISGWTADVTVIARGAGIVDAGGLKAADAKLTGETAGQVTMSVKRAVTGTMTGSGAVIVLGKPACKIKNLGSGSVACAT